MMRLFVAILVTIIVYANGFKCCLCGETPVGKCYEPGAPDRTTMKGRYTCNELHEMGLNYQLNPRPCSIAQAWGFLDGEEGCDCPVDNRPVKKTPPCSTCAEDEIEDVYDDNGSVKWFYFTAGALTCRQIYGYALDGFIPQTICKKTKEEVLQNGCCGAVAEVMPNSNSTKAPTKIVPPTDKPASTALITILSPTSDPTPEPTLTPSSKPTASPSKIPSRPSIAISSKITFFGCTEMMDASQSSDICEIMKDILDLRIAADVVRVSCEVTGQVFPRRHLQEVTYTISNNSALYPPTNTYSENDMMYLRVCTDRIDIDKIKKNEYKLKIDKDQIEGELIKDKESGCFEAIIDIRQLPFGQGRLNFKLEDNNKMKVEMKDIHIIHEQLASMLPTEEPAGLTTTAPSSMPTLLGEVSLTFLLEVQNPKIENQNELIKEVMSTLEASEEAIIETALATGFTAKGVIFEEENKEPSQAPAQLHTPMNNVLMPSKGYILSKRSDFSTGDVDFLLSDTLHMMIWPNNIKGDDIKRTEYEIKVNNIKFRKETNRDFVKDGQYYKLAVDLKECPLGSGTVKVKFQDNSKNKYEIKNVEITVSKPRTY